MEFTWSGHFGLGCYSSVGQTAGQGLLVGRWVAQAERLCYVPAR